MYDFFFCILYYHQAYHKLKRFRVYIDDLHREWLVGFSQSMGKNEALRLLKDVGKVKGWK